ncbi:replicative helicase loader/inhibitor [Paenibacillus methanolicus]|nr:replicative helicase loader/inhibitor [Paenibacillus methanolicus]
MQTIQLLGVVSTAYPLMPELTNEQIELWVFMLADIPFSQAQANLKQHILTSRFPPTIADVSGVESGVTVDYEQLRLETAARFAEMDRWEQVALPACPDHLRPKLLCSGKAVSGDEL